MPDPSVSQCACGSWYHNHPSGLCKACRQVAVAKAAAKARRKPRKAANPAWGSQEWAETYTDNIGESEDR